ncbi:MAG: OmpA family protein, partial [Bacteroidia bacterium]|nr:OmpA family protein [Bacteroidia bacterium]
SQAPFEMSFGSTNPSNGVLLDEEINEINGSDYSILTTAINTKYSEIGSGMFKGKLIMVSSKKIGALGNGVDPNTGQPFTDLFCIDIKKDGQLKRPLLFSRILNTKGNEGQVAFSEDEKTIYFTRSTRENSKNYQLYKADLMENSNGNWINIQHLDVSSDYHSVENPFIRDGHLFFASDRLGGFGGFDLYSAKIKEDGSLEEAVNLGENVNSTKDEKYPFLTKEGKYLYFSSTGHKTVGGFDVFASRVINGEYRSPKNLGTEFNSKNNEIAFFLTKDNQGYVSSNKNSGEGNYDIYRFYKEDIKQLLKGVVVDAETQIPLPNSEVVLVDEEGREIGRQVTNENAEYDFPVVPFDIYKITVLKDGFVESTIEFEADKGSRFTYTKNLELNPEIASIKEVDDKLMIVVENIYFDFDKSTIKDESTISLNKVVDILNGNPEMKIEINAHTDSKGKNSYNLELSENRAASAMKYLISKGIDANRLVSKGYGETQPLVDCKNDCTDAEDQINRRIEFVIIK